MTRHPSRPNLGAAELDAKLAGAASGNVAVDMLRSHIANQDVRLKAIERQLEELRVTVATKLGKDEAIY